MNIITRTLLRARIAVIEADIERLEQHTPGRIAQLRTQARTLRAQLATHGNADAVRGMVERNAKRTLLA